MRYFLSLFIVISLCTSLFLITDAQAKRFGGGRSFGMQRSITSNYSRVQPTQPFANPRMASPANKWGQRLAGLALGGFLAYLFMGHGLGSGLLSWVLIAGAVFLLMNLFRSRSQAGAPSPVYQHAAHEPASTYQPHFTPNNQAFGANPSTPNYPVGFDADTFLRNSKVQFIRLQAAYDQKNLQDLREFTTPEMVAEIQLQFQDRGTQINHTVVEKLEAQLLDVATEFQVDVASVRFSGLIQEEADTQAQSFSETWHFRADKANSKWFVAGIQQD